MVSAVFPQSPVARLFYGSVLFSSSQRGSKPGVFWLELTPYSDLSSGVIISRNPQKTKELH